MIGNHLITPPKLDPITYPTPPNRVDAEKRWVYQVLMDFLLRFQGALNHIQESFELALKDIMIDINISFKEIEDELDKPIWDTDLPIIEDATNGLPIIAYTIPDMDGYDDIVYSSAKPLKVWWAPSIAVPGRGPIPFFLNARFYPGRDLVSIKNYNVQRAFRLMRWCTVYGTVDDNLVVNWISTNGDKQWVTKNGIVGLGGVSSYLTNERLSGITIDDSIEVITENSGPGPWHLYGGTVELWLAKPDLFTGSGATYTITVDPNGGTGDLIGWKHDGSKFTYKVRGKGSSNPILWTVISNPFTPPTPTQKFLHWESPWGNLNPPKYGEGDPIMVTINSDSYLKAIWSDPEPNPPKP